MSHGCPSKGLFPRMGPDLVFKEKDWDVDTCKELRGHLPILVRDQ